MNILILEDEEPNFMRLKKLVLSLREKAEITGLVDSVAEAKAILKSSPADLILADIRLSDGLVFEAFDGVELRCPVIFTTAYDEYAIKAFRYNGMDYLLKPIVKEELAAALDRYDSRQQVNAPGTLAELYNLLHREYDGYRQRFLMPDRDGLVAVAADDIRYIDTDSGMVRLYLSRKRCFALDISLDEIERRLDPDKFMRVTRNHIINISAVERLTTWFGRKTKIQILDWPDADIFVTKEKAPALRQRLER